MSNLRDILKKKNIKISTYGKEVGATSNQICNWFQRGEIPKKFVKPTAKFLNMTIEQALELKASKKD